MSMIFLWGALVVWEWMNFQRRFLAIDAQARSRFESLRQASLRRDREVRVAMESYRRFVAEHDIDTASTDALLRRLLARPARMVVLSEPLDGPWNGPSKGPHAASPRLPFIAVNGCQCADCRARLCAWVRGAIDAYERAGTAE